MSGPWDDYAPQQPTGQQVGAAPQSAPSPTPADGAPDTYQGAQKVVASDGTIAYRRPDGSLSLVGNPNGATSVDPATGATEVTIGASSNPDALAEYDKAHPYQAPAPAQPSSGVPAGAPQDNTPPWADYAPQGQSQGAPQKDDLLGLQWGIKRPLDNAAAWVESGLDKLGVPVSNTEHALGFQSAQDVRNQDLQYLKSKAAQGITPGIAGQMAGDVIGTLPTLMLPGGALIQGAAAGALTSDDQSLPGVAAGAALGGIGGNAADMLTSGVINTVAPRISAAAQSLLDRGVPLTTGMIAGSKGLLGRIEQLGQNVPVAGELIRKRGNEALTGFNSAVANEALAPIGAKVAPGTSGHELYQNAKQAIGDAYDAVGKGAAVPLDGQYAADMMSVHHDVNGLPVDLQNRFSRVVSREVTGRVDPTVGGFTSEGIKDAKAALNKEIAKVKNPTLFEGDYADALKSTRNALTSALGRTSPEAQAQLAAADAAYPRFKAYEGAVKNSTQNMTTPNGYFTPQQLQAGINAGATNSQRAAAANPLQALAEAGKEILPRRYKDVISPMQAAIEGGVGAGVIGSDVLGGPHAGMALAAPAAGLGLLYTKPVQDALRKSLVKSAAARKALEAALGAPLEKFTNPPARLLGSASTNALNAAYLNPPLSNQALAPTR